MVATAIETYMKSIFNAFLQLFCPFLWKAAKECLMCTDDSIWAVTGEPWGFQKQQSKIGGKMALALSSAGWKLLLNSVMAFPQKRAPIVLPTYGTIGA